MNHTEGTWTAKGDKIYRGDTIPIGSFSTWYDQDDRSQADAARAVECVNALDGIGVPAHIMAALGALSLMLNFIDKPEMWGDDDTGFKMAQGVGRRALIDLQLRDAATRRPDGEATQ